VSTWHGAPEPPQPIFGPSDWLRIALRGAPMGCVVFGGLALTLVLRLIERPLFGMRRPVTPSITRGVCQASLAILGIKVVREGTPLQEPGAMVANHASWLDIFVLNAATNLYFVSKAEVAGWPGIGWLARATGTVFIERDRRHAAAQARLFEARLRHGHRLLFFPEGTSTDGMRVLPFKTTLFEAFRTEGLSERMHLQSVAVIYHAPKSARPDFYGWWGEMDFGPHLLRMLAAKRHGSVTLVFAPPVAVGDFADRKALARHLEAELRARHEAALRQERL
jgi:1-acyl-sn-glycerol-3-phosphate acyltransferase